MPLLGFRRIVLFINRINDINCHVQTFININNNIIFLVNGQCIVHFFPLFFDKMLLGEVGNKYFFSLWSTECSFNIYGHTKNNTTESLLGNVNIPKKNAIVCYTISTFIKIKHL